MKLTSLISQCLCFVLLNPSELEQNELTKPVGPFPRKFILGSSNKNSYQISWFAFPAVGSCWSSEATSCIIRNFSSNEREIGKTKRTLWYADVLLCGSLCSPAPSTPCLQSGIGWCMASVTVPLSTKELFGKASSLHINVSLPVWEVSSGTGRSEKDFGVKNGQKYWEMGHGTSMPGLIIYSLIGMTV